jgi:transposase-like protein
MKNNSIMNATQARIEGFMQQLVEDPVLGSLASPADVQNYLQAGFSALFNAALVQERSLFLEQNPETRANGFAPTRQLQVKTIPITVERPRARGDFYPAFLPKYQRHIPQDYQELLEHILVNSKSFDAALRTMQSLGSGYSRKELEALLTELEREANTFHQRPLSPDWLVLYIDAKELDLKDEHEQVKKAVHFIAIGVNFDARKEVLCSKICWGNETIDCWRQLFVELKNRGLTRMLLLVTDDFSGLKNLVDGFWPHTDHQLCCVHLLRNARRQLAPEDYAAFRNAWREIIASSSLDTAREKWLALLEKLRANYPAWAAYLQPRTDHYLCFMNYPPILHRNLRSTNLPEGINNLIETIRRNAGGHFHTQRELNIKMKILIDQLAGRKWSKPNPMIAYHRATLIRMFKQRFESELPNDHFLTQNC